MKIKYSRKIDREIFNEVNIMGKKLSPIFGFDFPKVKFDKRLIPIAKATIKVAESFIDEKKIREIVKGIYNKDIPDITIYVNTTPFSTWDVKNKWISVSIERVGIKFFNAVCHEINHFMYDYCLNTKKYEDTEIKETLTVLNNIFGIEDKGWKKFSEQRKRVIEYYNKTKDFKKTIHYTRNLFKKRNQDKKKTTLLATLVEK